MNYTEELRNILLEYTKTFPTHLYFETDSIFVKLLLEDKSDSKYKFEIRNKGDDYRSENPYKFTPEIAGNQYSGYLNNKEIYATKTNNKKSNFESLSKQSVTILKQIRLTRTDLRHPHP